VSLFRAPHDFAQLLASGYFVVALYLLLSLSDHDLRAKISTVIHVACSDSGFGRSVVRSVSAIEGGWEYTRDEPATQVNSHTHAPSPSIGTNWLSIQVDDRQSRR